MKNMGKTISAGNKGGTVRSDCAVTIELTGSGGIRLQVESKVKSLFGRQIEKLVLEVLAFYEVKHAVVSIEDAGALPFVMAARLEAAIRKLIDSDREFLIPILEQTKYTTAFDRNRVTRLYLPGNTPSLMINAGLHRPDGIILDLEDAVAPDKKYEAAFLVRNALRNLDFYGTERMVRINQVPQGLSDLDFIIPHGVHLILIPKCEDASQIHLVNERIDVLKKVRGITGNTWLMPIIESAPGVIKSYEIATAAANIVAMAIGLEDYTADIGAKRTAEGLESLFARSQVVNACRAAGIQPIDSVFSDVADLYALKENVLRSKGLGFEGMGCIHPRQIEVVRENFAPDADEIDKAKQIVLAYDDARAKGIGVISLGTKMIDQPIVKRARRVIEIAVKSGKINDNWREEYHAG
jgi:citrate lyase subunit beta/citryl-CoA lyase